jgi:hypothetical protein
MIRVVEDDLRKLVGFDPQEEGLGVHDFTKIGQ